MDKIIEKEFEKEIYTKIGGICICKGYKKKNKHLYYRSIRFDSRLFIEIYTTELIAGEIDINIYFGVCFDEVNDVLCHFVPTSDKRTFRIHLLHLVNAASDTKMKQWKVCINTDNSSVYKRIESEIIEYGIPFHNRIKTPDALLEYLVEDDKISVYSDVHKTVASIFFAMGDYDQGKQYIENILERQRNTPDVPAKRTIYMNDGIVIEEILDEETWCEYFRHSHKMPEGVSKITMNNGRKGGVSPWFLDFYERYVKLCESAHT